MLSKTIHNKGVFGYYILFLLFKYMVHKFIGTLVEQLFCSQLGYELMWNKEMSLPCGFCAILIKDHSFHT